MTGRGSELEGAARSAQLALARGFDHRQSLDQLQKEFEAGRAPTAQMAEAQVAVEEARIRLSLFRAEAAGLRGRGKD